MKLLRLFLLASSLAANITYGNELSVHSGDQCLVSLNSSRAVLNHFNEQSNERSKDLQRWMVLASPKSPSALGQAVRQIEAFPELTKNAFGSPTMSFQSWRSLSLRVLQDLRDQEVELKRAIDEVGRIITSETKLIKNALEQEKALTTEREDSPAKTDNLYLTTRIASLIQIKSSLEKSLLSQYQMYFQLRNKIDLTFPPLNDYLHDRVEKGGEVFLFSDIHRQVQAGLLGENWVIEHLGLKGPRIVNYDSLSFKTENILGTMSRKVKLQSFVYNQETWPRYYRAIKTFGPIAKNPPVFVGQAISLTHFPSPGFAEEQFTIANYDSTNGTFELTHPRSGISVVKVNDLVGKQIQLQLLKDIQVLIKNDKPVLVIAKTKHEVAKPLLITKISLISESFAGIEIGDRDEFETESDINWMGLSNLEGIPLAINADVINLDGPSKGVNAGVVGQVLSASHLVPSAAVIPLTATPEKLSHAINFYLDRNASVPFDKMRTWKPKVESLQKAFLQERPPEIPSFIEKMESIRLLLEQNGFFRERATSFMASTWEQRQLIEFHKSRLSSELAAISDFESPGLLARFKNNETREQDYLSARLDLPRVLTQTRWLSKQTLDGNDQAVHLVKEILETIQRYQSALPGLLSSVSGLPDLSDSVSIYVKERVVLLNQLVRSIAEQQAQFEKAKKDLGPLLQKGNDITARLNLKVDESFSSVDNGYRHGVFQGYRPRGKLTAFIYGGHKGKEILQQWFTESSATLRKRFSPAPSDFKLSIKLAKGLNKVDSILRGQTLDEPFDVTVQEKDGSLVIWRFVGKLEDIPENETLSEESTIKWQVVNGNTFARLYNEHHKIFSLEFAAYIEKHGALYSQAINQLIIEFNPSQRILTGISKDGFMISTRFDEAPLFWEAFSEPMSLRTPSHPTQKVFAHPFIGQGKDLHGRSYYVYRVTDQKGLPTYKQLEATESVEKIPFIKRGELIPNTSLVAGQSYILLDPAFNKGLMEAMAEKKKQQETAPEQNTSSKDYFNNHIGLSSLAHFIHPGTPLALTKDNLVYFDGSVANKIATGQNQIPREQLVPLATVQEQIALPPIDSNSTEAKTFWKKHNGSVGSIKAMNAIMMAKVPETIVPGGGTLIYGYTEHMMHNYTSPPFYILVFNQNNF